LQLKEQKPMIDKVGHRRTLMAGALMLGLLLLVTAAANAAHRGYPNAIAVLGHSGATGESSDPNKPPHYEARENSWATGTNPAVKSLYLRLLAVNPKIKGHNFNLAQGGADVRQLYKQATVAVPKLRPRPDLFVIQIMDNDIRCDGTDETNFPKFRRTLTSALKVLAKGAPDSHIFVVSQFGSPGTALATTTLAQRKQFGGGGGPCDAVDASGRIIPKRLAYLESVIHGYEAALASACKQVTRCRYDRGAFGRIVDRAEYVSSRDPNHFSIKGHAKAASVAWAAMKQTAVIPSS
jgi:hypothetical protein